MRKIISLLIVFIAIPCLLFSQKVDIVSAKKVAANFYYEKSHNADRNIAYSEVKISNTRTIKKIGRTLYYIFDLSDKGYVIVSANNATFPVIGYSLDNIYIDDNQPPAYKRWMQEYEKQINETYDKNIIASEYVNSIWSKYLNANEASLQNKATITSVLPLLKSKWNQDKYYNGRCPEDAAGPGQRAYAGCVPTAMGQVMNYYRWPLNGTGSYTYLDSTYGNQTANFAGTDYLWDEMPLSLNSYDSSLAILLYHLGVSVDLKYGAGGSGMYNHKAAYSLKTYFKYSPETQYMYRDTTVHLKWKQIILDHLNNNMPMYYAGWSDTIYVMGHAFVCDGYSDTTFFHFNWGWGGSSDNYFNLDGLNPSGNNFNLRQELIVNMFPDTANYTYPYYCSGTKLLDMPSGTIDDGSGPIYDYKNDLDCLWLIAPVDSVSKIKIEFLKFDTQKYHDSVFVYNGPSITSPLLGAYSGSTLPALITSSGSKVLVRFKTDADSIKPGWLLSYTSVIPVFCSSVTTLTAPSAVFTDGSGNKKYKPNTFCRWIISPSGAASINIHFNGFALAKTDYVRVRDFINNITLAEFTGDSIPHDVVCNSASAQIWFKSNDNEITGDGFEILYTTLSTIPEFNTDLENISIFPNPVKENLNISLKAIELQNLKICIINALGTTVYEEILNGINGELNKSLDMTKFPEGLYFVTIRSNNNLYTTKVVRNR
jgi:hypothetical protein